MVADATDRRLQPDDAAQAGGDAYPAPRGAGARAAPPATPDPLLAPPGARGVPRSHGFQGVPMVAFVPQLPKANSTMCVLPIPIMPAAARRRTTVAVTGDTRSRQNIEPPVVT